MAKSGSWDESIPKSRRCEAIQMLLCNGADVHAVNPRGRGVLHLAVTEHDLPAIETFIEGMADVNAQDLAGFTPLMWAAGRDSADGVKMLLDCEAGVCLCCISSRLATRWIRAITGWVLHGLQSSFWP